MTEYEKKDRIIKLDAELASIKLKSTSIQLGTGLIGVYLAKDKSTLTKVGYFFLGSVIGAIPNAFLFSKRASEILAEKQVLENNN